MDQELRAKINQAMNSPIVGDYIFSGDELEALYSLAEDLIPSVFSYGYFISAPSVDTVNAIFVALVNACKDWGSSEDSFYDFLDKKIKGVYVSRDLVVGIIEYLKRRSNIYTINVGKKYYATMLSHSLSPISSTESFFEMCWEIYSKDLRQQYVENDPVNNLIVKNLQNKFRGRSLNDDISIGSKVYAFRVGIIGMLYSAPEKVEWLLNDVLGSIDRLFNNEPVDSDTYIHKLLRKWWQRKLLSFGEFFERKHREVREKIVIDYSQIKPKYVLDNGIPKVVIPAIRLVDNFDYNPRIKISSYGKLVVNEDLYTYGSGILMATEQKEYSLANICFAKNIDIHIEISHNDKIIYDSKESLNRDFILFCNGKETTASECLPGYYFVFVNTLSNLLHYPSDIQKTAQCTYGFNAVDGDVIHGESRTVFFSNEDSKRDLYFYLKETNNILFRFNAKEYKVIDGELYIVTKQNADIRDIGVRYEDAPFKLSEFLSLSIDDQKRYEVSNLLNVGEPQNIIVFKYSDNSILANVNIIKFKNIRTNFDKPLYYGKNETGTFEFQTEKYHEIAKFDITEDEISIPLENGELITKPPVLKWKIDNGEWSTKPLEKGLWCNSLTNSSILTVSMPEEFDCSIVLNTNKTIERSGDKKEFKIGQTIHSLHSFSQGDLSCVTVMIKTNFGKNYIVGNVYFKERFFDNPLLISSLDKKLIWNPASFMGDEDSKFVLTVRQGKEIVDNFQLKLEREVIDCSHLEDDDYTYEIKLLGKGFLQKDRVLFTGSFFIGDRIASRFKNKSLCIKEIVSFGTVRRKVQVKPIYIDEISYLGKIDNFYYYSGYLYVIDKTGKKIYLDKMYDEKAKCVKRINPVRIELKSDQSCYLGYGLDLDDEDFEYDDEFALDYKGRTTIGTFTDGKRNSSIDYFVFGVKRNV